MDRCMADLVGTVCMGTACCFVDAPKTFPVVVAQHRIGPRGPL